MRLAWSDAGSSLIELLVASAMGLVLLLILGGALMAAFRTDTYTDQDSQALAELRTSNERLVRELRQAAKVYAETACYGAIKPADVPADEWKRRLRFWVDSDRRGDQDDQERIEWRLYPTGDGKAELTRRTDADPPGPGVLHAELVLDAEVFDCNEPPPDTDLVRVTLTADTDPERYSASREVRTEVRLRNVPD